MSDHAEQPGDLPDDLAEYLQTFLDETEEQLDDLVETMLALEQDATNHDDLNEAFRLIHSIKGSAGMMGFDSICVLTHHLENRFERFRSGTERLDRPTTSVVLRCIDYLRQCNNCLRNGEQLGSATELLEELRRLEEPGAAEDSGEQAAPIAGPQESSPDAGPSPAQPASEIIDEAAIAVTVQFRAGLQLADLKAQLIVARLSELGEIKSTQPDLDRISDAEPLASFQVLIETPHDLDRLRSAADLDGVESIEFAQFSTEERSAERVNDSSTESLAVPAGAAPVSTQEAAPATPATTPPLPTDRSESQHAVEEPSIEAGLERRAKPTADPQTLPSPISGPATEKGVSKAAETMRVDIDRLDNLMNLTGELVINRARFVQISEQLGPTLRKSGMLNRLRDFNDGLRRTIDNLQRVNGDWSVEIQQLQSGLELLEEQSRFWTNGRRCFSEIGEAIDQLSRVSHGLQRGVLDTRMVSVGPLFSRFKRVVRDLSTQRNKKVQLLIRGEKTELDKRMIDELGDPLVHLVRNSIDHGLEPIDVRVRRGKSEVGVISLEASHRGNNVFITVADDGGGIDVQRIKAKLIDKRILPAATVAELSDEQAIDYIWHPGFSTAGEVTDVSGRGVGMDVVKTRINKLNGAIDVASTPQSGTTFTIRLPLTLAIINSLLVRLRNTVFSMPIDDIREIVSLRERDLVTIRGKQTFDVRGQYLPLVGIEDVFQWHGVDYGHCPNAKMSSQDSNGKIVEVVILQAAGKTVGLRVDEMLGSQDIVIKSLSVNFVELRGLSGASILGDGSVCLMLDVGAVIDMANQSSSAAEGATS